MDDDNYEFSAYSALFNAVNNSIFIRDGVANQVFWIYPSYNENNLKIRNEHRLKKVIFDEIRTKYNARINNHNLTFRRLGISDIDNLNIVRFITSDGVDTKDSGRYQAFPRTFRCTKCNGFKVLKGDEWKNFNVDKCQNPDCDGKYVQVSVLGFCETCGNVETVTNSCPTHHYDDLELIQPDKESVKSWRVKCRKCGWKEDFKMPPCNHRNFLINGREPMSNENPNPFQLINVQRGGLFQSCVKTTVDVPPNNESEYIDEIIIGVYLNEFDQFGLREGRESFFIQRFLEYLEKYPEGETREEAIEILGIPEETFTKAEKLKEKIISIKTEFVEYSLPDIVDYLILIDDSTLNNNRSFNQHYQELSNLSKGEYEKFKNDFGILDIIHIPDIQLISSSYGSIRGINKFYELDFTPHFEPHWEFDKESQNSFKREKFNVYSYPFETEGIMFDLDKIKVANWIIDNSNESLEYFTNEADAKSYLFNLKEDSEEFKALYTLIHSFSHVLIKRSSLFTGLDSDSCSELIFPKTAAFMIYSTSNINIGGFSYVFENSLIDWFNDVKYDINECIFDPSCFEEDGACFSCLYLPEFVCCLFNQYLDRDVFLGNKRYEKGFWNL